MINFINNKIILPLNDRIQGYSISENLDFLLKSQSWSGELLAEYQVNKLRLLIFHAYRNVQFYNNWFKSNNLLPGDIHEISDLKKLPVITKNDIRKDPSLFRAKGGVKGKPVRMYSSGSTGEPFEYFISRNAFSMKYAAALRGWNWMGYTPGDPYAKLSQNKRSSKLKRLQDFINNSTYVYIPDLTIESLKSIINKLEDKSPRFVRCYPDPLVLIAQILRDRNKKLKGIKAINTTGNILTDESRKIIEEWFDCPVFDSYSCEGSALFYQSPIRDCYLGSSEYAVTEVLDSDLNEICKGETGLHITTDLHNYAMPMIRYNTQDLVEKPENPLSSGFQLKRLSKIVGRDNDILITPSGNFLIAHLFTIYFEYFNPILQFQVEQTQINDFIFRFVVDQNFNLIIEKQIKDYWQKFLGNDVNLKVEVLESIPASPSGKRRFLIRNPEIKLSF